MHIHARGLLYFDAIRRNGSIRGAARQLFIDASAVNRQLLQLEQELGFALFERLSSGLQLTPAGELFARHATRVLQDAEWLENELDMLRGLQRGKVHVVGVESLHSALLPEVIGSMLERYPGISLQVTSASSGHIAEYVANGRADVGMAFDMPQHEDVEHAASGRFRLGALVTASHPLARKRSVTLAQCTPWPFILGTEDLPSYALIQDELKALPEPPKAVVRATSVELMKRLASAGHGIARRAVRAAGVGTGRAHPGHAGHPCAQRTQPAAGHGGLRRMRKPGHPAPGRAGCATKATVNWSHRVVAFSATDPCKFGHFQQRQRTLAWAHANLCIPLLHDRHPGAGAGFGRSADARSTPPAPVPP
ncbi:LysR family transcriptional regulator [Comamonas guangdongensis]|uniref:LysR family transcriptional regulator n=1 Tax=Comamonas guangdongensis TaxID=510515 RepID=A0ABV3ZZB1_9BURK